MNRITAPKPAAKPVANTAAKPTPKPASKPAAKPASRLALRLSAAAQTPDADEPGQRGLLVPPIDVAKQLRLLETRREVERLICRSAAKRATPEQRAHFTRLAEEFTHSVKTADDVAFVRADREFNELCLVAARNEFAEGAMRLMHGLSRRFWYLHYKEAADMPVMARLHARVAVAIAKGDIDGAGNALDALLDNIEDFTRATVLGDRR
jgi:DNA-binding GntR family transcriptional regulator